MNQLIDVLLEDECVCLAYIVAMSPQTEELAVHILTPVANDRKKYMFEPEHTIIHISSVAGYYDSCDIAAAGYTQTNANEFVKTDGEGDESDTDPDYSSDSTGSGSGSESVCVSEPEDEVP